MVDASGSDELSEVIGMRGDRKFHGHQLSNNELHVMPTKFMQFQIPVPSAVSIPVTV